MRNRAGRMNKFVKVFREAGTITDSRGQPSKVPELVDTVWASIEPLRGNESILARQLNPTLSHRITIRWSSEVAAIDPRWWIEYDDRYFFVNEARNIEERDHTLELICGERL